MTKDDHDDHRMSVMRGLLSSAVVIASLSGAVGCAGNGMSVGDAFALVDDLCIAGKVKQPGADYLNTTPGAMGWHEDYLERVPEGVRERDRILSGDCSDNVREFSSSLADLLDELLD